MKIFIISTVCLCLVMVSFLVYWMTCSRETYKNKPEQLLSLFLQQANIQNKNWKILKEDKYNNKFSLWEVGLDDIRLFLTVEKYKHREEIRLIKIENLKNKEWKARLYRNSFLIVPDKQ